MLVSMLRQAALLVVLSWLGFTTAQLSGKVGPLTTYKSKAQTKICDITDYGAVNDGKTDSGPAIQSAWNDCKSGGLVYVPAGNYAMETFASFTGGSASALQLDGTLIRASDDDADQMINIRNCDDFEFFSGNSRGALQGYGYKLLQNGDYGPRFFRIQDVTNFSVHGFAAIDSASYYFAFNSCENGEIYNILARGISIGMTDAFDLWGSNLWIHDIEVTNGDECVTVKSPAENFLIENIYCNLSGGTAIGSLGTNTDVHDISYKHLYMNRADACYLKTNNGDGTVKNIVWDTVIVHRGPYPLAINEAWGTDRGSNGVLIHNLTFKNWHGQESVNSRPVIRLECDPDVPCYDITVSDVNIWTNDGDYVEWSCQNAYGSGACLKSASNTKSLSTYTTVSTVSSKPYYATSYMPSYLSSAYPSTKSFTVPPVPTTFYPGQTPISKLLSLSAAGGL